MKTVFLPTVSGLARASECAGSEVILDRVNGSSDRSDRGNELHAFCDAVGVQKVDRVEALKAVSKENAEVCVNLDVEEIYSGIVSGLRSEVAYAVDMKDASVRELGHHLGREYPETSPTEVKGSEDFEGLLEDGTPIVGDIKTGKDVGAVSSNWQIRFFAYCALVRTGASVIVGRIAYVREDGSVHVEDHRFSAEELLGVPEELSAIRERLKAAFWEFETTGKVTVSPGDHCTYCAGFMRCPAKTAAIQNMSAELGLVRERFAEMTQAEAAKAWVTYETIKPMFYEVEKALKEIARTSGIELEDGRKVRAVESTRASFSKEKAVELLKAKGATDEEIEGCIVSTPVTSVRALGRKRSAA